MVKKEKKRKEGERKKEERKKENKDFFIHEATPLFISPNQFEEDFYIEVM